MPDQTELFNSGSVIEQVPDVSFTTDVSGIKNLQEAFPEYRGKNPHSFKKSLIENKDLFGEVSDKYFQLWEPENVANLASENPEQHEQVRNTFKRRFKQQLVESAYAGQNAKETIVNRSIELTKDIDDLPIEQFKSIIQENSDRYRDFGILEEDGTLGYGDDTASNTTFGQNILEDSDLHKQVQLDFYRSFENELNKSHNSPSLVTEDMTNLTRAYKIYSNYGSEGLTQYVNLLQHADADEEGISASFQRRQEAEQWFESQRSAGRDPDEQVKEFIVGSKIEGTGFDDEINRALDVGVAPSLLAGMIRQESNFDPNAISRTGAGGILQFQPAFARENGLNVLDELYELDVARMNASGPEKRRLEDELRKKTRKLSNPETDDRFNPEKALEAGTKAFQRLLQRYDFDPEKAVAAWNAGSGAVDSAVADSTRTGRNWKEFVPQEETAPHIERVMNYANEYGSASPLIYQEPTPRKDITENVPEDANNFTAGGYKKEDGEYSYKDADLIMDELFEAFGEERVKEFYEKSELKGDGWEMSKEHKDLAFDIFAYAYEGEGEFDLEDLMNSVLAHSTHSKEGQEDKYTFNYNELPTMSKVAFNAIQNDPDIGHMIQMEPEDGTWSLMPNRMQHNYDRVLDTLNTFRRTKTVAEEGDDGEITYKEVPDNSGFGGVWNALVSAGAAIGHTGFKFAWQPLTEFTSKAMERTGYGREMSAFAEDQESLAGISIFDVMSGDGVLGSGNTGLTMAGDMAQYMGSMFIGGQGVIRMGAAGLRALTGVKTGADMMRYTSHMGAGSATLGAKSAKLTNAIKNKEPWRTSFGVFVPGGAVIEATQPASTSFYNILPEMFGYEPTNDVRRLYNTADRHVQVGMDFLGSVVFDWLANHILATTKYGAAHAGMRWFGKKEFKSINYNSAEGHFDIASTPQYRTEFQEFWHNMGSGLDRLPMGAVGESFVPKSGIKTFHGFMKSFTDENSDVLTNVKQDIEDNVRWFNNHLGDAELSEEQIGTLVQENYDRFMRTTSDRMYDVLNSVDEEMPIKFANSLELQSPTIREFSPDGAPADVRRLHEYRSQGHNVIAKGDRVFEIDPKFWTVDLARSLKTRALKTSKDDVLRRLADNEGIPENPTGQQLDRFNELSEQVENVMGATVRTEDGRIGYVVDFDNNGYLVKTEQGTQRVTDPTPITPEQSDNIVNLMMRNIERYTAGEFTPELQTQRLLPEPDVSSVEGRLVSRVENIDNEIAELRRRHEVLGDVVDDTQQLSNQRQQITRQISELENQRQQSQRELSRFLQDNPELQAGRAGRGTVQPITNRPDWDPQKALPAINLSNTELRFVRQIDEIDNRISDLQRRYNILDDVVDDSSRRGNLRREITRELDELRQLRRNEQRQLSQFLRDNPELQANRRQKASINKMIDDNYAENLRRVDADKYVNKLQQAGRKGYNLSRSQTKIPYC